MNKCSLQKTWKIGQVLLKKYDNKTKNKPNTELLYNLAMPFLGACPEQWKVGTWTHTCTILCLAKLFLHPKGKASKVLTEEQKAKQNVTYL